MSGSVAGHDGVVSGERANQIGVRRAVEGVVAVRAAHDAGTGDRCSRENGESRKTAGDGGDLLVHLVSLP